MIILGAGLAGCMAGALLQDCKIYEFGPKRDTHKAVLRFRSDKISKALGIPFTKVKVYKGIWDINEQKQIPLSIQAICDYSQKVSGTISYRSITKLDTVDRWIAPYNFHDLLRDQCDIVYDADQVYQTGIADHTDLPIISTLPLHVNSDNFLNLSLHTERNVHEIYVTRYKINDANVHMTYYYPHPDFDIYRASISGDILIIESIQPIGAHEVNTVMDSFGINRNKTFMEVTNHVQKNGKIAPINETLRRDAILQMTLQKNVYSLGRFATWRNLLLDDVYDDILVIKKLMNADKYEHMKEMHL